MRFESRFGSAADAYKTFRPDYPRELFDRILAAVPPSQRNRAIDLGAGTGRLTQVLAGHFTETIAVEPDPLMAGKLREAVPRAVIRPTKAEDLVQEAASVDLITIAAAFHWMDAAKAVANAESWLRPGGILAICGGRFPQTPKPVREVVRQEFNDRWNQFRDPRLSSANSSAHARGEVQGLLDVIEDDFISNQKLLSAGDFAGFCRSTSYASAYARTIPDADPYWRDLENRFREAWPEERFPVDFSVWLLLAKKDLR
jgi:trans-aconitate methyltransferase